MDNVIVLDIETTGFDPQKNRITELGAIKVIGGEITSKFSQLINPEVMIPEEITDLTGISDETVEGMPTISEALPLFVNFCEDLPIMGHNIMFDFSFIKTNAIRERLSFEKKGIDTLALARNFHREMQSRSLSALCSHYSIFRQFSHRAYDDAVATYTLFCKLRDSFMNDETKDFFEAVPLHWKPQKMEPITHKQEKFLLDLVKKHNIKLIKPINEFSKSEASKEIDRIISNYGK